MDVGRAVQAGADGDVEGLVRVSTGPFNTAAEIDTLIGALKEVTGGI